MDLGQPEEIIEIPVPDSVPDHVPQEAPKKEPVPA